jgi:hypothetical protein
MLVGVGRRGAVAVATVRTPAIDDVERVCVGCDPPERLDWHGALLTDAPDGADFGVVDLRPFAAFVARTDLAVFVVEERDARAMRLDRFVGAAREAGAVTVAIVLAASAIDSDFGADVAVTVAAGLGAAERLSGVVGAFVDPVLCIGIVGWYFEDFREISRRSGVAEVGLGRAHGARGEGRAAVAARRAADALSDGWLGRAAALSINVRGGPDLKMSEIEAAVEVFWQRAGVAADIVYSADVQEAERGISVAIVALEKKQQHRRVTGVGGTTEG